MSVPEAAATAEPGERVVPTRGRAARYSLIVVGFAVYFAAVSIVGWRKVGGALAHADFPLVAAAAALTGAGALTRMWKWRRALGAERHAIGVYFISRSAGVWSPARVGEFLPLLWKRHRSSRLAGWILFDRVLEVLVALGFGLGGLPLVGLISTPAYTAIAVGVVVSSAGGLYVLTRRDLLERIAGRAAEGGRVRRTLSAAAGISGELRAFLGGSPNLAGLTVMAKAMDLYSVVLIFRALGASAGFALVAASKCALAIVSYVPVTPMATGVPHAVQGWMMLESAGIQPDTVVASVAIEAAIMFVVFSVSAAVASRAIKNAAL